jgi:hypothetical protein
MGASYKDEVKMSMLPYQKMKILVLLFMLFGLKCPVFAQTLGNVSINIADASLPDSPIKVMLGQISFIKSRWEMHLDLRNASQKTIVAYEVSVDLSQYGGKVYVHCVDNFFSENLEFISGAQISVDTPLGDITVPQRPLPSPSLSVVYANFGDGTHYGSSEWGKNLSEGRAAAEVRIKELLKVYHEKGRDALESKITNALDRRDDPKYVRDYIRTLHYWLKKTGVDEVIATMGKHLAIAQKRENIR